MRKVYRWDARRKVTTSILANIQQITTLKLTYILAASAIVLALPMAVFAAQRSTYKQETEDDVKQTSQSKKSRHKKARTMRTLPGDANVTVPTLQPQEGAALALPKPNNCTVQSTSLDTQRRGMWVWQTTVVSNVSEGETLFAFASEKGVNTLYVESEKMLRENRAALGSFIERASNHCIGVELLFGAADWSFTRNHSYVVSLAEQSVAFAKSLSVAPVGIHFDVEPYNTAEYKADPNAGANQYLDMLEKIKKVTDSSGMYLAKSIPLGFKFQMVQRDGSVQKMSEATISRVDRVVLMAYRDTASRVLADTLEEAAFAAKVGTRLVIGAETDCNTGEVQTITYCEEGSTYMEQQLALILSGLKNNPVFNGLAIHDYAAYRILKP